MPITAAIDDVYLGVKNKDEQDLTVGRIIGGVYGFSTLDMLNDVRKTGRYYVPWANAIANAKGVRRLGLNKFVNYDATRSIFPKLRPGRISRFAGVGLAGKAMMGASRTVGVGYAALALTDPLWFAISAHSLGVLGPAIIPGILWFGGKKFLSATVKNLEDRQFVRMNQPYSDSQSAVTSRQRAVRAISESHLQARSAIGNEAMLMHR